MKKILNFIVKASVYGLVFFTPLFFLPWTAESYEFNKAYLIFFLVCLAFLAWLAKMIVCRKEVRFKLTLLDLWILVFAVVLILSAVFSKDQISSWLGFYSRFSDSVIGLLCLIVFYFVLTNNISFEGGNSFMRLLRRLWLLAMTRKSASRNDKKRRPSTPRRLADRSGNNSNSARSGSKVCLRTILWLIILSFWIVIVAAYLSVFGVWQKMSFLPEMMKLRSFNPTSASLEGLAVFLVFGVSLIVGIVLKKGILVPLTGWGSFTSRRLADRSGNNGSPSTRFARSGNNKNFLFLVPCSLFADFAGLALAIFLLILIDFKPAWWILALTTFVFLAMALWTRLFRKNVNILLLPIIIFILSVLFLTGLPKKLPGIGEALAPIQSQLPQELILSHKTNFPIVWQAFKNNPILGSGPATYLIDFVQYKPVSFNEDRFWNVRFDRAPSQWAEMFATVGGLGVLSYLAIIVFFFLMMLVLFNRKRVADLIKQASYNKGQHPVLLIPLFLAWLALLFSQVFYYQNTVLGFYFWIFTALAAVSWYWIQSRQIREIKFSFDKLPEVGLVLNVILMLLCAAILGLFYSGAKYYWADVKFSQDADNWETLTQNMEKAAVLNRNRENYRRTLSQIYLNSAWREAGKPKDRQDINAIQFFAGGALQQARLATTLSPNIISAWENLGAIYRDSSGLVSGALPFAIDAYFRATELEPNNPIDFRELCRLNLINDEKDKDWEKIMGYCQQAVDLKPNYLDAHIQLALAYEQKGEIQEAIKRAEDILEKLKGVSFERGSALAGAASEIYFQLGRLYFNLKEADKAINYFEQATVVAPEYANARYGLALAYQNRGRNSQALEQLKIVDQLVPGNENVRKAIEELEK